MHHYLVIPAYNESLRLPRFLEALAEAINTSGLCVTVQVVDDGSAPAEQDAMRRSVEAVRGGHTFLLPLYSLDTNQGKGAAVRAGWAVAPESADWLVFVDADGAICPMEVVRILSEVQETVQEDAWFASRICMLGRKIERSWGRHVSGRIFASMVGCWIDSEVYDSQCGFKGIRRESWRVISAELSESGFAFDVELLAALRSQGASLREVPIDWSDQAGSKVNLFRDSFCMAVALRRIRRRFTLSR